MIKKVIFIATGWIGCISAMESPKEYTTHQRATSINGLVVLRSIVLATHALNMCQETIPPITATELLNGLGFSHDEKKHSKKLQFLASLLYQQDLLMNTLAEYESLLELRILLDGKIIQAKNPLTSIEPLSPESLDEEFLHTLAQIADKFAKKNTMNASIFGIHALSTYATTPSSPGVMRALETTHDTLADSSKILFDTLLQKVAPFVSGFELIKPLKLYYGYLYPLTQTYLNSTKLMGEETDPMKLDAMVYCTDAKKIDLTFDIKALRAWYATNKPYIEKLYTTTLAKLAKLRHSEFYGKNLFSKGHEALCPTLARSPFTDRSDDEPSPSACSASSPTSPKANLQTACTDDDELIAAWAANKKSGKHGPKKTLKKKSHPRRTSHTPADEASSSNASSPCDGSPCDGSPCKSCSQLDKSDSDDEPVTTLEIDPTCAFAKSATASLRLKKSDDRAASSSSSPVPFVYRDRTLVWQRKTLSAIYPNCTDNTPYKEFMDLAEHRVPFVLEQQFSEFAQLQKYTSQESRRHYDVQAFDGAIIIADASFKDEEIHGKTLYGTFEISCCENTTIIMHRRFKPYGPESIIGEQTIETGGTEHPQVCNGHFYIITENDHTILIREPGSPINVTYIIFKNTHNVESE